MSARTSARSALNRQQPSSPRRTRSQSVELPNNEAAVTAKRRGKRNARQGSIESDVSSATSTSSRQSKRKKASNTAIAYPDLSMVAEDGEAEDSDEDVVTIDGFQRSQSPGGMSQLSGTTMRTTHTEAELQDLDSILVEFLPDLLGSSLKILDLLAPPEAVNNPKLVDTISKDLKVLGSRRAKKLKHFEEKFRTDRDSFGTDLFIRVSVILEKILGSGDPPLGDFRPDALLYAANLTTLVKDLLVTQKENTDTHVYLEGLDTHFPGIFLSGFAENAVFGNSSLLEAAFSVGLAIRTQTAIAEMIHYKDHPSQVDLAKILADCFFDVPDRSKKSLSYFENLSLNGKVKDIMAAAPNTADQIIQIKARVERIRKEFRNSEEAREAGDLVDFEQLDEKYPWQDFVAELVTWARLRLDEITRCIQKQGGVDNIVRSLIETIKNNDSQVDLEYDPPATIMAPRHLLPAADIQPSPSGTSFYKSKSAVIALEKARLGASAESSSSKQNQQRPSNIVRSSALNSSRNQAAGTSTATPEHDCDDFGQDVGDDEGNIDEPRPTAEYVASYSKHSNEKNKENRPISGRGNPPTIKKPSLMDPHPDAVRHRWESQHEESSEQQPVGPSKRKRPTRDDEIEENEENQESEESEDQGFFETDDRLHGSKRRVTQQTAPQRDPGPVRHPHAKKKRAVSHDEESATESERRNRAKPESILQSSARGQPADLEDDEDSSDDEPPNSTQVRLAAMTATQRAKRPNRQTQTRSLWSQNDSDQLVDLIENYGCSWAEIQKIAEFERGEVGQVALKDRARNLKVNFLKAEIPLPINFDKVALGKKEIRSVRQVCPELYPDPDLEED